NELWCTDYKGEFFLLGNGQYCYPLTVTDHASRFLLTCEALSSTRENYAFTVFERLFQDVSGPDRLQMAGATGLEPATSCVTGRRSNQLNYAPTNPLAIPSIVWTVRHNPRPKQLIDEGRTTSI